jgi:uncharacterized linocin/CFP29 family protein
MPKIKIQAQKVSAPPAGVIAGLANGGDTDGLGIEVGSGGSVVERILANGGNIGALRTLSILRENEWRAYDTAVTETARGTYTLVSDMMENGLRTKLPNPMATPQLVWDRQGDMTGAQIDMTGESNDIRDRMEYGQDSMPIPLIHKGFRLNIRTLWASRQNGTGLDVSQTEQATRVVVEATEKLFLYGNYSAGAGVGRVYGMTTYPYRNVGVLGVNWLTATGTQIFDNVNSMVEAAEAKGNFGPFVLYIPRNWAPAMRRDYDRTTNKGTSVLKRILEIESIKAVKTNVFLPLNNVILLPLNKNTAEVLDGIQPRLIEWSNNGGMELVYKVISIVLPRLKRDGLDQNGIVHFIV